MVEVCISKLRYKLDHLPEVHRPTNCKEMFPKCLLPSRTTDSVKMSASNTISFKMADGCNHTINLESSLHAHILQAVARQLEYFYSTPNLGPLKFEISQEAPYCRVICQEGEQEEGYDIEDILPRCPESKTTSQFKSEIGHDDKNRLRRGGKHPRLAIKSKA